MRRHRGYVHHRVWRLGSDDDGRGLLLHLHLDLHFVLPLHWRTIAEDRLERLPVGREGFPCERLYVVYLLIEYQYLLAGEDTRAQMQYHCLHT